MNKVVEPGKKLFEVREFKSGLTIFVTELSFELPAVSTIYSRVMGNFVANISSMLTYFGRQPSASS